MMALLMTSALYMQVLAGVSHSFHLCNCSSRNFLGVMTHCVLLWQLPFSCMKKNSFLLRICCHDIRTWEKTELLSDRVFCWFFVLVFCVGFFSFFFFSLAGCKILKDGKVLKLIFRYLSAAKSCWPEGSINETTLHRNAEFMLSWIIYISKMRLSS